MPDHVDRPDDSAKPRHKPDSVAEEVSAMGQRFKGKVKEELGDITDDKATEEKGKSEKHAGRERQRKNDGA